MALTSEIRDKKILSMYPVSGGDINSAFQLTLVDGTQLFMKRNSLPFFELEAKGLEATSNGQAPDDTNCLTGRYYSSAS